MNTNPRENEPNFYLAGSFLYKNNCRPTVFGASLLFFIAVAGLFIAPWAAAIIAQAVSPDRVSATVNLIQALFYVGFIFLPACIYVNRMHKAEEQKPLADPTRKNISWLRMENPVSGFTAILLIFTAIVVMFLVQWVSTAWIIALETVFGPLPNTGIPIPKTTGQLLTSIFFSAILPGFFEEILCRGILLSAWESHGSTRAIIISAIWFTCMHQTFEGLPAQLMCGLILGYIAVYTNSLMGSIIFHTVYNASILIYSFLLNNIDTGEAAAQPMSSFEALGGFQGLATLVMLTAVTALIAAALLRAIKRRSEHEKHVFFGIAPVKPRPTFGFAEYAVMGAAFSVLFMGYLEQLLMLMGWIG